MSDRIAINRWLGDFKAAWVSHDIDAAVSLFADDVEYWETPYRRIADKGMIRREWQAILTQQDIKLSLSVFGADNDTYSVMHSLDYMRNGERFHFEGIYLIRLNAENLCSYFYCIDQRKQQ